MKIHYVKCPDGAKLFSFYRHHYNEHDGCFIDGGFDYIRHNGELCSDDIFDVISDIRTRFYWGVRYDKDGDRLPQTTPTLLKDLSTSHIHNILSDMIDSIGNSDIKNRVPILSIFINELKYRLK